MEQQSLKRFPDSSVSSPIPTGWTDRLCGRASHHQKLAPTFPGIDRFERLKVFCIHL